MRYKIIQKEHILYGKILSTNGCIQTENNQVYGYVGLTPVIIDKKYLKEI